MVQRKSIAPILRERSLLTYEERRSYQNSDEIKMYPELSHHRMFDSYKPLKPVDCYKYRSPYKPRDLNQDRLRHIDLRLSQNKGLFKPRLPAEVARMCWSDFPDGICPRPSSELRRNLEQRAQREALNYSSNQDRTNYNGCSVNYTVPLKIFGSCKPLLYRQWEKATQQRPIRERAQSAPPCSTRRDPLAAVRTVMTRADEEDEEEMYSSSSSTIEEERPPPSHYTTSSNSAHSMLSERCEMQPNFHCECHNRGGEEEEKVEEGTSCERNSLQSFFTSVDGVVEDSAFSEVVSHFSALRPSRNMSNRDIEQLKELMDHSNDLKVLAALVLLDRLSSRRELCDALVKQFFRPVVRKWVSLINNQDCAGDFLKPIVGFVENITMMTSDSLWLDDVYKEMVIEQTTAKLTYDGTRAHYCTLLLRVFSDSPCCANALSNTALPEFIMLPQVKQSYWEQSKEPAFFQEDVFLQEEILKIFCNIAHSSGFGRKVLICHAVIESLTRILAYATCKVQYQAALLCGALCSDVAGCDHVTSILTNQRVDNDTSIHHLVKLFLHSKCLYVKAATGAALYRMFSISDRQVAHRSIKMIHEVIVGRTNPPKSQRPKTAPPRTSIERTVTTNMLKEILSKYLDMCTSKGPFSDPRFFRCRVMAVQAVTALIQFPLKLEGRAVPFHHELAKLFFTLIGETLFKDLKLIADKHRYVKVLQDKIQKIQISLIKKTRQTTLISEILEVQLEDMKSDNSILKIPSKDFEMARNELVYCECIIKNLSVLLSHVSSSLNLPSPDSETLLDSTRRYNSQYTTLQDSLYNKYALSVLPAPPRSPLTPRSPGNKAPQTDLSEQHLNLVKKLLGYQVVESLVPWLHCVYPPITEKVVRCVSSIFTYSSVHGLAVHCQTSDSDEAINIPEYLNLHPSEVARYMNSTTSITPSHVSNIPPMATTIPPMATNIPPMATNIPTMDTNVSPMITISQPRDTPSPHSFINIPGGSLLKPDVVVEQCTHHIGHLCSGVLTQSLLISSNHTVSRLAAQLLRDIAKSVTREQLLCMVDDYLLEKLAEYIILCNGDEERIFVALDILETLIDFQPTLGKLYHIVGGLNTLVARLLAAGSPQLKQKLLVIINSLPNDERWCQVNKVDCLSNCQHLDVWHKVTGKWENQDNVSKLMSIEL